MCSGTGLLLLIMLVDHPRDVGMVSPLEQETRAKAEEKTAAGQSLCFLTLFTCCCCLLAESTVAMADSAYEQLHVQTHPPPDPNRSITFMEAIRVPVCVCLCWFVELTCV